MQSLGISKFKSHFLTVAEKNRILENLWPVWEKCNAEFQELAHRKLLNSHVRQQRIELEETMSELEKVFDLFEHNNLKLDKFDLQTASSFS